MDPMGMLSMWVDAMFLVPLLGCMETRPEMKVFSSLLLAWALAGTGLPVHSEVLLLEAISSEPPNTTQGLPRPTRGMSMEQVLAQYGEPMQRLDAVGLPPISRWVYSGYTVYFEDKYTLSTVVHR